MKTDHDKMEGSRSAASRPRKTCIQDLPDECLGSIIHLLNTDISLPIRRKFHEDMSVQHALQCALVCKRWRSVVDSSIRTVCMNNSDLDETFAQHLGKRFRHLTSVTFNKVRGEAGDPLATLALQTPQLEYLKLGSSYPFLGHTMLMWTSLRQLDLGRITWNTHRTETEACFDALAWLTSLQRLDFDSISVPSVRTCERLVAMTNLTRLALVCYEIPPVSLSRILYKLQVRDLSSVQLSESLGSFNKLESLVVSRAYKLSWMPNSLGLLSQLTCLRFVDCPRLGSIPDSLGQLSSLRTFEIHASPWVRTISICLHRNLVKLVSLQRLLVLGLNDVPQSLSRLTNLTSMEMGGRWSCPEDLENLPSLRELLLKDTRFLGTSFISPHVCISSLKVLRIQDCNELTHAVALRMPLELKHLEISNSYYLTALPQSLRCLSSLRTCKLSELSSLPQLPDWISECRMLSRLEVSRCPQLTALPEGLGQLSALKELLLEELCSLVSLPQSLGGLSCLRLLRVTSCKRLIMLPDTIADLDELRAVQVEKCDVLRPETQRLFRRMRKRYIQVILS